MVGQRTGRSCHGAHDLPRSKPPPAPPFLRAFPHFEHFVEVAPGFWNLHTPFKVLNGALDVCTHMSVCRLADDRFIAIDAAPLSEEAQRELAELTRQGSSLVAVIMTHPFHTLSIPGFHALYPSSEARPWYGCPRHLLKVTKDSQGAPIAWKGDLADVGVRDAFEPEIAMSVPDGGEIVDPKPPDRNHLSTVLVLHRPSRTVHCDDLLNFIERPSLLLRLAIGKGMHFHPSLLTCGLHPTPEAPADFRRWLERLLSDWDFDNVCTAHTGNKLGGAKRMVSELLRKTEPSLQKLVARRRRTHSAAQAEASGKQAAERAAEPGLRCVDCWTDDPAETECG